MPASPSKEDLNLMREYRSALVGERRRLTRSAFELWQANNRTDATAGISWAADIRKIQEEIEAVDRAIQDEARLLDS